ncbi:hypothetical protein Pelo_7091 [Pelomyxa schiedti]|nr:hypothetical protein Pelo_7091 [Pelomyxa schiedti]
MADDRFHFEALKEGVSVSVSLARGDNKITSLVGELARAMDMPADYVIKYLDGDNDWVTMQTDDDLDSAVCQCNAEVLKLEILDKAKLEASKYISNTSQLEAPVNTNEPSSEWLGPAQVPENPFDHPTAPQEPVEPPPQANTEKPSDIETPQSDSNSQYCNFDSPTLEFPLMNQPSAPTYEIPQPPVDSEGTCGGCQMQSQSVTSTECDTVDPKGVSGEPVMQPPVESETPYSVTSSDPDITEPLLSILYCTPSQMLSNFPTPVGQMLVSLGQTPSQLHSFLCQAQQSNVVKFLCELLMTVLFKTTVPDEKANLLEFLKSEVEKFVSQTGGSPVAEAITPPNTTTPTKQESGTQVEDQAPILSQQTTEMNAKEPSVPMTSIPENQAKSQNGDECKIEAKTSLDTNLPIDHKQDQENSVAENKPTLPLPTPCVPDTTPEVPQTPENTVADVPRQIPQSPYSCEFLKHTTLPDGSVVPPNQNRVKIWHVKNSGTLPWPKGCRLVTSGMISGSLTASKLAVPCVAPNSEADIGAQLAVPSDEGKHVTSWELLDDNNLPFARLEAHYTVSNQATKAVPKVPNVSASLLAKTKAASATPTSSTTQSALLQPYSGLSPSPFTTTPIPATYPFSTPPSAPPPPTLVPQAPHNIVVRQQPQQQPFAFPPSPMFSPSANSPSPVIYNTPQAQPAPFTFPYQAPSAFMSPVQPGQPPFSRSGNVWSTTPEWEEYLIQQLTSLGIQNAELAKAMIQRDGPNVLYFNFPSSRL